MDEGEASSSRYFSSLSTTTVATVCSGPSWRAIAHGPATFMLLDVPVKILLFPGNARSHAPLWQGNEVP